MTTNVIVIPHIPSLTTHENNFANVQKNVEITVTHQKRKWAYKDFAF